MRPNVSSLAKKSDYNTKISEIENKITTDQDHDKYSTTKEFNKLIAETFTARLAQANLASKSDIASFVKKTDFLLIKSMVKMFEHRFYIK